MENERVAEQGAADELEGDEEQEYDLESMETEDLDDAMREALAAVERSREHVAEAGAEAAAADRAEAGGAEPDGDLADLEAELAELRDRSVRTLADFDNYRKRISRERGEERRYAAADLAQEILAVVDNLERALGAEGSSDDLKQGVDMIHRQLLATLGRHGIQRVAAQGEPFDPVVHEAVMRVEEAGVDEPMVRDELQSGYKLYDRLLRPAMVKVAVPAADEPGEPGTD